MIHYFKISQLFYRVVASMTEDPVSHVRLSFMQHSIKTLQLSIFYGHKMASN